MASMSETTDPAAIALELLNLPPVFKAPEVGTVTMRRPWDFMGSWDRGFRVKYTNTSHGSAVVEAATCTGCLDKDHDASAHQPPCAGDGLTITLHDLRGDRLNLTCECGLELKRAQEGMWWTYVKGPSVCPNGAASKPLPPPAPPPDYTGTHTLNPYLRRGHMVCQDCGAGAVSALDLASWSCDCPGTRVYAKAEDRRIAETTGFADGFSTHQPPKPPPLLPYDGLRTGIGGVVCQFGRGMRR